MMPILDYNTLIGIHIDSAVKILELYYLGDNRKISCRVTKRGDNWIIGTRDYNPERINLRLNDEGIVIRLDFG